MHLNSSLPEQGKENLKKLLDNLKVKNVSVKYSESISNFSKSLRHGMVKGLQEKSKQTSEAITSFRNRNNKLKNLEKLLHTDKSHLITSNKRSNIYRSESDKLVIIDKNIWSEPVTVTIKQMNSVTIKCVKFLEEQPFLFPVFNEKTISGRIIYMDVNQLWYQDNDTINVVTFRNSSPDFIKIKINNIKCYEKEALIKYVKNYISVQKSARMTAFIKEKAINIADIVRITRYYLIEKSKQSNSMKVYLFDDEGSFYDQLSLSRLPSVDDTSLDLLFTKDMTSYIKSNNYPLEDFKQNDDFIEFWQNVGSKKVCVMRFNYKS
ncbi:MAG: hypothetical protein N3B21_16535 [Clostridia bacterium]|nr:hypothetical protein [Clostridia bacterium]